MHNIRTKLFWLLDLIGMLVAFFVTVWWVAPTFRSQLLPGGMLYVKWVQILSPADSSGIFSPASRFFWVFAFVAPVTILCIDLLGGHRPIAQQRLSRIFLVTVLAPFLGISTLSTLFFVLKTPGYSRTFVVSFALTSFFLMCAARLIGFWWRKYTLREGIHAQDIAIIGLPEPTKVAAERIKKEGSPSGYEIVGYFSLSPGAGRLVMADGELPSLGEVGELENVLVHQPIGRVVMIVPPGDASWLEAAVKVCDYFRVTVDIVPGDLLNCGLADLVANTDGVPGRIRALTLAPPESQPGWLFLKRVTDVTLSAATLVTLAPLFLAIAIAIKITTPHLPIFYPWRVVGYRGRRFTGYKFTTMVADADTRKNDLAPMNEMSGPVFKIAKDPRVTPLGRFLRKYSLNELPQFWSVLRGDMSLVGPRPAGPHELQNYEMWHKRKLSAQPGITCLWQVMGRNRISSFDDWVRLDLEYIKTRTFWIDCKILVQTAWVVVRGTGS
jgi:exopolysaccharide biosynthesis polyprenyl glycosylphosphotransferase